MTREEKRKYWLKWFKNHDDNVAYIKRSDDAGQIVGVINEFFKRNEIEKTAVSVPRIDSAEYKKFMDDMSDEFERDAALEIDRAMERMWIAEENKGNA